MSLKPLNSFSFLGTPERMKKSCDDLETEIKNNPTGFFFTNKTDEPI